MSKTLEERLAAIERSIEGATGLTLARLAFTYLRLLPKPQRVAEYFNPRAERWLYYEGHLSLDELFSVGKTYRDPFEHALGMRLEEVLREQRHALPRCRSPIQAEVAAASEGQQKRATWHRRKGCGTRGK